MKKNHILNPGVGWRSLRLGYFFGEKKQYQIFIFITKNPNLSDPSFLTGVSDNWKQSWSAILWLNVGQNCQLAKIFLGIFLNSIRFAKKRFGMLLLKTPRFTFFFPYRRNSSRTRTKKQRGEAKNIHDFSATTHLIGISRWLNSSHLVFIWQTQILIDQIIIFRQIIGSKNRGRFKLKYHR